MSVPYLVGGLCVGILTGGAQHEPWQHLPPSFVRAGWALGVVALASLLHTVPPCSWAFRCILVGGLLHLLWPPLSEREQHACTQLALLAEGLLLGVAALLLVRRQPPAAVLLGLVLVWAGVLLRHSRI